MSTSTDDLFDEEPTGFARWIVPALIISLLLHVIFYMWANGHVVQSFSESYFNEIVPRTFRLDRVDIDPRLLEPEQAEDVKQAAAPTAVKLPEEKVELGAMVDDMRMTPSAPEIENPSLAEKPQVESSSLEDVVKTMDQKGTRTIVEDPASDFSDLIDPDPVVSGQPLLEIAPSKSPGGSATGEVGPLSGSDVQGFSNLDGLLAQTGPLTDETAPILMPADLLFDYDSYQVRGAAMPSLEKLGMIVQRNPGADFTIEGHTDSFGDDGYNLKLSQARAESVKAWLVQYMNIAPGRIRTEGFGESRLIAPASGSIDEQQINRRVEIVIHVKKAR